MNCAEARRRLQASDPALDGSAELHLASCLNCFDWLEAQDPVVSLIRAAQPAAVPAPARLAVGILSAWGRPARVRWELVAAAVLLAAGLGGLAVGAAANLPQIQALMITLTPLGHLARAILAVPQGVLLGNPAWLAALLVAASGACVVWFRLDQDLLDRPRSFSW